MERLSSQLAFVNNRSLQTHRILVRTFFQQLPTWKQPFSERRFTEVVMVEIHPMIYPSFALIAGILILIFPPILNFIVAVYLIVIGVLGLIAH